MLVKSVSAVVILAVAAHASAPEPMPYKPLVKMSVHQMFGLGRRQSAGYQPTQTVCGTGATCADACGAGYVQCASNDDNTHCYDPSAQQTCCPDGTGNSCDSGYYCTQDTESNTWCCPDGMSLTACAAAYSITGSLVSETASPTSSAAASSTTAPITSSTAPENSTVTTDLETDTVTTCPSAGTTLSYPSSNSTLATITPTQSPTQVVVSGANVAGPAGALIVVAAAAIAALL